MTECVVICNTYYYFIMSPHPPTTFRIDPELIAGLQELRERDGVPVSEQVRRAIQMWLESKGVKVKKAASRRASTRRKT